VGFALVLTGLLLGRLPARGESGSENALAKEGASSGLEFIETDFENASPVWYEVATDGVVNVYLHSDNERGASNRASGHIHFLLHAAAGTKFTLEFKNLDNIYNGRKASIAPELKALVVSENGKDWKPVATRSLPGERVQLPIEMPGPKLYVARVEPYRLSDLKRLLKEIRASRFIEITPIGKTVAGQQLEIVRVGDPDAPHHAFVRARAHPWEAGGNWVTDGLIRRLIQDDAEAGQFRKRYCLWVLPMANKDGVARGRTRFNLHGKDLNRNWDRPADLRLSPENHALEAWLEKMIQAGRRPGLALELHNDGHGQLHPARAPVTEEQRSRKHMAALEVLLRKHTWFTEGSTKPSVASISTLADGWRERYGIESAVHEFNCQWIAGVKDYPTGGLWRRYGSDLARVLYEYFGPE
jgi:hypothetical protein